MRSVGIGWVNTLNAPPGTTGQIPSPLVTNMKVFGDALRSLLVPVASSTEIVNPIECTNSTASSGVGVELDGVVGPFNAIMIREDLSNGQRVASYAIDHWNETLSKWVPFTQCDGEECYPGTPPPPPSAGIPPTPQGTCGPSMTSINLVKDAPPSCHEVAVVQTADACEALCQKDTKCNFWTWHDLQVQPPSFKGKCYVRYDGVYDHEVQTHHVSGVCNHTLSPGGGGGSVGGGVHGLSVGARLIDFVTETTSPKVGSSSLAHPRGPCQRLCHPSTHLPTHTLTLSTQWISSSFFGSKPPRN
jgi:hypothetical protein